MLINLAASPARLHELSGEHTETPTPDEMFVSSPLRSLPQLANTEEIREDGGSNGSLGEVMIREYMRRRDDRRKLILFIGSTRSPGCNNVLYLRELTEGQDAMQS